MWASTDNSGISMKRLLLVAAFALDATPALPDIPVHDWSAPARRSATIGEWGDCGRRGPRLEHYGRNGQGCAYMGFYCCQSRLDNYGTLRVKAGIAIDDGSFYATDGIAFANREYAYGRHSRSVGSRSAPALNTRSATRLASTRVSVRRRREEKHGSALLCS
jgi:hypothetical protein